MLSADEAVALGVADNKKLVELDPASITAAHEVSIVDGTTSLRNVMSSWFSSKKKDDKDKSTVTIYKPSKQFCPHRFNNECPKSPGVVDITRFARIEINAPPIVVEKVWLKDHEMRRLWDSRTAMECRKLTLPSGHGEADAGYTWFLSQPKVMISPRDFLYVFKTLSRTLDPETGALVEGKYGGCSLDFCTTEKDPEAESWIAKAKEDITDTSVLRHASSAVRGQLQGLTNVKGLPSANGRITRSEVTYLLRVRPRGMVPKKAAELAASELLFTVFDMRARCESLWQQLLQRRKRKAVNRARVRSRL